MKRDWSLDLPVACRHLLPMGDRRVFHQVIRMEGSLDSQLWLCLTLPLHCQPKVSEKQGAMELYHPPSTATLLLAAPETPAVKSPSLMPLCCLSPS